VLEHLAPWWQDMVTATLDHLGIPHEVFYRDVQDELAAPWSCSPCSPWSPRGGGSATVL